jgi:alpha-ketoglutarate-dependent taurine dioxygenase
VIQGMSAPDAIFDLAVNRAAVFMRGAGRNANLDVWHARTRFASRVPLESIRHALALRPARGEWHWSGGTSGAWRSGKPTTP